MTNPIVFPSITPNFSLPLLFMGQAQKEPFINQALLVIDSLLDGTIDGSLSAPPNDPITGSTYRVLAGASDDWQSHDNDIAIWVGQSWTFIEPREGLSVFDKTAQIQLRYLTAWESADSPTEPSGGSTVDIQARTAITELISALKTAGIFSNVS